MVALLCFVVAILASPLKSRSRLEAETTSAHYIVPAAVRPDGLTNNDRWFVIQLYRWFPSILNSYGRPS